jgi:hypothetical protein
MRVVRAIFVLVVAAFVNGCGGKSDRLTVYAVKGTMTYDKKSPEGAMIVFHPLNGDAAGSTIRPSAVVQKDGSFVPTTYNHGDGLPAGEYALTIFWPRPPGKGEVEGEAGGGGENRLPAKYGKPETSGLKVVIDKQATELKPINLTR